MPAMAAALMQRGLNPREVALRDAIAFLRSTGFFNNIGGTQDDSRS